MKYIQKNRSLEANRHRSKITFYYILLNTVMASTNGVRSSNREALLDVLESLIAEGSVHDVTLDGVAARAGITKGGLIYHFKSKEALLHGLIDRIHNRVNSYCVGQPMGNPQTLKAFLVSRINYAFAIGAREKKVMAHLLVAAATYPSLLKPVKMMYDNGTANLEGLEENNGLVLSIWTALDGFLLLEMLNVRHFSEQERQQMKSSLISLVEGQLPPYT